MDKAAKANLGKSRPTFHAAYRVRKESTVAVQVRDGDGNFILQYYRGSLGKLEKCRF